MTTAAPVDPRAGPAQAILNRFCAGNDGRSVALTLGADAGPRVMLHVCGDTPRPLASVIKVALIMALYDLAGAGRLDLAEQVSVTALGATRYCSIMRAFDHDRTLSLRELAAIALITSDNPVAVLLEDRVGRGAIHDALRRAGVAADHAHMRVGFCEDELGPKNRANVMSALDVVKLFRLLRDEPRYEPIVVALENNLRNARIPALLPDDAVIAHKTGSLQGVVNDAGIVRCGTDEFAIAFLCDAQADVAATANAIAMCSKELFGLLLPGDE